jgi:hypothetical protein
VDANQYIAKALYNYLIFNTQSNNSSRCFFRISGFDIDVYQKLLEIFRSSKNVLAGHPLWIRTTAPISGYDEYALEAKRSATWYRNHIPSGHVLILIFNERTSDVQSLKDIYRVTEGLLAIEEQIYLINATCVDYQLSTEQIDVIRKFLGQLEQKLFQPQLRDLVNFLLSLNAYLHKNPTASIESAIAQSLPEFGLFRCTELASKLNTSKGNRLLLDIFKASQFGTQILDVNQLNTYLARLKNAKLESDYHGKSAEQKRSLIHDFLTEVVTDHKKLLQIFQIDWNEVAEIFFEKTRRTKAEQLQDLAETLQDALEAQHFTEESLPEVISCTLEDLKGGRGPKEEDLDDLLVQYGDILPGTLKNRLRRLKSVKKIQGTDFIASLLLMVIELILPVQNEVSEKIVLKVEFDPEQIGKLDKDKAEALLAFRTLYGGVESVMPSIRWNIGNIWEVVQQAEKLIEEDDQEREGGQEKIIDAELIFRVTALASDVLGSAELVWLYRSDGPTATTLAHVRTEAKRLAGNEKRLSIPIYNTCPVTDDINDLDLSRPIGSFGVWYREFNRLRDELWNSLAHIIEPESWDVLKHALDQLEEAWGNFIRRSATIGILAAGLNELLAGYEKLLEVAANTLRSRQEATYGYRVLTQAWIVGPKHFDEWAFVPFLHPLKLHWWYERSRYFNALIDQLIDPTSESPIVDERRFRQELYSSYGSANYPAILALPGRDLQPHYFLPVHEVEGYELFRCMEDASLAYGLDPNLVSEDEGSQATKIAASELAHVINDYLETYPYVYDGLQIYVIQCRNGALPGLLIENLKELTHHKKLRLNLVVHTVDRGAPLYQNVMEWLKSHEEFTGRSTDTYFPQVTLTVLQCSYEELFQRVKDTDIVILPDVLAENGQVVKARVMPSQLTPLDGYFPIYNIQRAPFERQELVRDILLNPSSQPLLLQHFYNMQWASQERDIIPASGAISFTIQVSLQAWEKKLAELHEHFRWVACYDTAVDRFLLEATLKSSVQVIRYSLGLGVKRRHNLTVSSSYKAQDVVERRLTINLENLLSGTDYDFRDKVAQNLITQAKYVSGDIVLRAAGPGAYLNELIGMVAAKHLTEQRYLQEHPGALYTWIYLDDFSHWFEHKLPDLLFVAIPVEANGKLPLHIEVIETKCISETYFASEALDAQRQIAQGINRLGQAWSPGKIHLDAPYWYDQLYQAVVGNLAVHRDQLYLWEAFRHRLPKGDFTLEMSGHTWVFCYDRVSGVLSQTQEGMITKTVSDTGHIPQYYHHYSRSDLRRVLRELVEAWHLVAPPEMWTLEDSIENNNVTNISR